MTDGAPHGASIQKTLLEVACDALGLAIIISDKNDEIIFASRAVLQFYPIAPHFLQPGTRLRDYLGALFDCGIRTGLTTDKTRKNVRRDDWISERLSAHWRERFEMVERIGRQRWIGIRKRRLPSGLCIVEMSDASEQKKREEQMQIDLERIEITETILDCLPNPICVKDRNLTYIAVNKAFCSLHGLTPDAVLGRNAWDLLEPELAEKFERSDRLTLESDDIYRLPEQIVQADGDDLWVVTRKFRVGTPGKYLVVTCMNDVTDLVFGQESRDGQGNIILQMRGYDAFEPAQNCHDPFRSLDMHHLSQAGAISSSPAATRDRVLLLTENPSFAQNLVGSLRQGGLDSCAVCNPAELLAFQDAAHLADLKIGVLIIDETADCAGESSRMWHGSPILTVRPDVATETLRASVLAMLERTRIEKDKSHVDLPTDWHITVPEPSPVKRAAGVDVLVAEDNEINQFVFSQILEGLGLTFRIADDGEKAVSLWQELRPNLVLMDISLPLMNGFDATRAIRTAEKSLPFRTPIIAVTSLVFDLDVEQSIAAGMDDYIVKPISPDMIEAVYRKFATMRGERNTG